MQREVIRAILVYLEKDSRLLVLFQDTFIEIYFMIIFVVHFFQEVCTTGPTTGPVVFVAEPTSAMTFPSLDSLHNLADFIPSTTSGTFWYRLCHRFRLTKRDDYFLSRF